MVESQLSKQSGLGCTDFVLASSTSQQIRTRRNKCSDMTTTSKIFKVPSDWFTQKHRQTKHVDASPAWLLNSRKGNGSFREPHSKGPTTTTTISLTEICHVTIPLASPWSMLASKEENQESESCDTPNYIHISSWRAPALKICSLARAKTCLTKITITVIYVYLLPSQHTSFMSQTCHCLDAQDQVDHAEPVYVYIIFICNYVYYIYYVCIWFRVPGPHPNSMVPPNPSLTIHMLLAALRTLYALYTLTRLLLAHTNYLLTPKKRPRARPRRQKPVHIHRGGTPGREQTMTIPSEGAERCCTTCNHITVIMNSYSFYIVRAYDLNWFHVF